MMSGLSREDAGVIERQLGRPPRGEVRVERRCERGAPVVVRTSGRLQDGTPFPTLFWLTCPLLVREVSRMEDSGLIRRIGEQLAQKPETAAQLAEAAGEYVRERDGDVPSRGGVGGSRDRGGLKCLHAHLAHYLARGHNPVGRMVHEEIGEIERGEQICESCGV